jgi:hypothetical protein
MHTPTLCKIETLIDVYPLRAWVGVVALDFRAPQLLKLVPVVALVLSGCKTTESTPESVAWSATQPKRAHEVRTWANQVDSVPLLANERGGQATVLEGTGRFVGELTTGAISGLSEDGSDGVTLNLVNVPTLQAAAVSVWRNGGDAESVALAMAWPIICAIFTG